jgi:hypothetical protein
MSKPRSPFTANKPQFVFTPGSLRCRDFLFLGGNFQYIKGRVKIMTPLFIWTAPAKHNDDGAFVCRSAFDCRTLPVSLGAKAVLKPPHSTRWRDSQGVSDFAKRLECGVFTAAIWQ